MRRPMHRPSTIDKLDPSLRHEVDRLRIEDGRTIDEIVAYLKTMGQPVSRAAMGRHVRSLEETTALLREKREMAAVMVREIGGQPEDKLAELAIELIQGSLVDAAIASNSNEDPDPEQLLNMSRSAAALAQARKTDVERVIKIEQRALKAAAGRAEKAMVAAGFSADTVQAIRLKVLGGEG